MPFECKIDQQINYLGWGRESWFSCHRLLVILLFLVEGVSSSSECLGNAALFHCGSPSAFNNYFDSVLLQGDRKYFNLNFHCSHMRFYCLYRNVLIALKIMRKTARQPSVLFYNRNILNQLCVICFLDIMTELSQFRNFS